MSTLEPVRVLYMESDLPLARLTQERMGQAGYCLELAYDGQTGLEKYNADHYDIVIVNHQLPIYDGLQVIRRLASRPPAPPVIILIEPGEETIAAEAMRQGASYYIVRAATGEHLTLLPMVIEHTLQQQQLLKEKQQTAEALHQHTRALAQLNRLGQELAAALDLQQIADQLARVATEIIGAESISVWLLDAERGGELVCWTSSDHIQYDEEHSPVNLRLPPGQGFAGWVAQKGTSLIIHNAHEDARFFPDVDRQIGFATRALIAVPLRVRRKTIGVLEVLNKLAGRFTEDDLNLVETLGASAAIAIDNARMVEELRQYAASLEAQNAELDAFAHTVAHDLKNPLSALIGFSSLLERGAATMSPETVRGYLQRIKQNGQKMTSIIDELLLLASVRKVTDVQRGPLDMASVVAEATNRLSEMIAEYQARVSVPDASAWPVAVGYGPWVEEVWANYLSNALKYGGRPPQVELGFSKTEQEITFWVRDNGAGLAPEEQAQLFTQFTRLHQLRVEGHGLGLSIVRRIVEKLGGRVGVESQVGQGSTFYFTLPAYTPAV